MQNFCLQLSEVVALNDLPPSTALSRFLINSAGTFVVMLHETPVDQLHYLAGKMPSNLKTQLVEVALNAAVRACCRAGTCMANDSIGQEQAKTLVPARLSQCPDRSHLTFRSCPSLL